MPKGNLRHITRKYTHAHAHKHTHMHTHTNTHFLIIEEKSEWQCLQYKAPRGQDTECLASGTSQHDLIVRNIPHLTSRNVKGCMCCGDSQIQAVEHCFTITGVFTYNAFFAKV